MDLWLHGRSRHTIRAYRDDVAAFRAFTGKSVRATYLSDLQRYSDALTGAPATRARQLKSLKSLKANGTIEGNVAGSSTEEELLARMIDRISRYRISWIAVLYIICSALPSVWFGIETFLGLLSPFDIFYIYSAVLSMIGAAVLERLVGRRRPMPVFVAIPFAIIAGVATGLFMFWLITILSILVACLVFHECL